LEIFKIGKILETSWQLQVFVIVMSSTEMDSSITRDAFDETA
jgi:hypothetical protein